MNEVKKLLEKVTLYSIASFGTKVASFLIVPYYTYVLSTNDYGYYDLLYSTSLLLIPIITLQTNEAIIAGCKAKRFDNSKIVKATFSIVIINSLIFILCFGVINHLYPIRYGIIFSISVAITGIMGIVQQYARGYSKSKEYALSGIIYTAIFLSSNIICLSLLKVGVRGLFFSSIIASIFSIVFICLAIPDMVKAIGFSIDKECLRWIIKYSLPLIPNSLCWWIISSSDRYVIKLFLGDSSNGIYALSNRFSAVLNTVTVLVYLAWQEVSLESYQKPNMQLINSRIFNLYFKILLCVSLFGIFITRPFSEFVIHTDYVEAWKYAPFLYMGTICIGLASFLNTAYLAEGKTRAILNGTIIAGLVNISLDLILIRYIGIYAAAISTLVSGVTLLILRIRYNQKKIGLKVEWKSIIILIILNVVVACIAHSCAYGAIYWISTILIILVICYFGRVIIADMHRWS